MKELQNEHKILYLELSTNGNTKVEKIQKKKSKEAESETKKAYTQSQARTQT